MRQRDEARGERGAGGRAGWLTRQLGAAAQLTAGCMMLGLGNGIAGGRVAAGEGRNICSHARARRAGLVGRACLLGALGPVLWRYAQTLRASVEGSLGLLLCEEIAHLASVIVALVPAAEGGGALSLAPPPSPSPSLSPCGGRSLASSGGAGRPGALRGSSFFACRASSSPCWPCHSDWPHGFQIGPVAKPAALRICACT